MLVENAHQTVKKHKTPTPSKTRPDQTILSIPVPIPKTPREKSNPIPISSNIPQPAAISQKRQIQGHWQLDTVPLATSLPTLTLTLTLTHIPTPLFSPYNAGAGGLAFICASPTSLMATILACSSNDNASNAAVFASHS